MIFTVTWTDRAKARLATLWSESLDRQATTRAADRIDDLLRFNAHLRGESRFDDFRILLEPPLGVSFRVSEVDRLATVVFVWEF